MTPVDVLVRVAPPILLDRYRPDCCIAATRHGIEALRYFGVDAKPVKTQAIAGNAAWHEWVESGGGGAMPEEAWSVAIDLDSPGGYPGHLVFVAEGRLVDLALGQLARPQHAIALPDSIAVPVEAEWSESGVVIDDDETDARTTLIYRRRPELDWASAKDWKRTPPLAGKIIRAMKPLL